MNAGDVAWILASSALVCMMIPALALFYGGMVGSRRILNMMMMCFGGASMVAVLWALFGYSMAFGNSVSGMGLIGDITEYAGMEPMLADDPEAPCPQRFSRPSSCSSPASPRPSSPGRPPGG